MNVSSAAMLRYERTNMKKDFCATPHQRSRQDKTATYPAEIPSCDADAQPDSQDGQAETQPTSGFASDLDVKPQSVRKRYSQTGSYFGIRPLIKLPNGRLRWPKNPVRILERNSKGAGK